VTTEILHNMTKNSSHSAKKFKIICQIAELTANPLNRGHRSAVKLMGANLITSPACSIIGHKPFILRMDSSMTPDQLILVTIAVAVSSILGAWFAVTKLFRPLQQRVKFWIHTWENFMTDWSGQEARPGRSAVPGVMQRLNDIDGELKNNGGGSLKDSVDSIHNRLDEGNKNFVKFDRRIQKIEKALYLETPIETLSIKKSPNTKDS
jgi:hypothetical protein